MKSERLCLPWPRLIAAGALLLLGAAPAWAQSETVWSDYPLEDAIQHGPGFYFSITKLLLCVVIFLLWVRTTGWVHEDTAELKLDYKKWNTMVFFGGVAGLLAVFLLPWFWLGFPVLVGAFFVPLYLYAQTRNAEVDDDEKVLTPEHFKKLGTRMTSFKFLSKGKKKKTKGKKGGKPEDVKYKAQGGATERDDRVNLMSARQSPAFGLSQQLITSALSQGASSILFDVTAGGTATKFQVDGFWEDGTPLDAEFGMHVTALYKQLAAMNPQDRRSRQHGTFGAESGRKKLVCKVASQGTQTGERVLLGIDTSTQAKSLVELGMREALVQQVSELLANKQGIFVVSAPPAGGLSATFDGVLSAADRYMRVWVGVEDVAKPEKRIENVEVKTYKAAAGETPAQILPAMLRQYPDAFAIREPTNAETLRLIVGEEMAGGERFVVVGTGAKECVESLLRLLMLQDASGGRVQPAELAPLVLGAVNCRLVRKLCENCRQPYEPEPALLQRLGLPPDRVDVLYRHAQPTDPSDPKQVCTVCGGRGFQGRTGIFELLVFNDRLRQVLAQSPKLDILRAEARKAGMRSLQEEGILLVAKGVTSIEELRRALQE